MSIVQRVAALAAALVLTLASHGAPRPVQAAIAFIDIVDGPTVLPEVVTIQVGDTVLFTNRGIVPHNPTARDGTFRLPALKPGEAATVTFTQPGTIDHLCTLHTSQTGTIIVLPAPEPTAPSAPESPPPDPATESPAASGETGAAPAADG